MAAPALTSPPVVAARRRARSLAAALLFAGLHAVPARPAPAGPTPAAGDRPKVWKALTEEDRRSRAPGQGVSRPAAPSRPAVPPPPPAAGGGPSGPEMLAALLAAAAVGAGFVAARSRRRGSAPEPQRPAAGDTLDDTSGVEGLWRRHLRRKRR